MSLESDLIDYSKLREKQLGALEQECFGIAAKLDKKLKGLSWKIDRVTVKEEITCWRS